MTFTRDIAPIIFENCAICHRPGESGPFSLLTYEQVRRRSQQIGVVTESRFMPPWLPEPGYGDFVGERRLTDEQIDLIQEWIEEGVVEGDPADLPLQPNFSEGWQLGTPDLVVTMAEAYTLQAEGVDVFRNFAIPVPLQRRRFVRAVEFRPGNKRIVHHAQLAIDPARSLRRLDAEDPEPGFAGMDSFSKVGGPDGYFLGWTPGRVPFEGTPGMAWRLDTGSDLILQLHLLPTGRPEEIGSALGLFFADELPSRTPAVLRLGSRTIDIPAGVSDYAVEDSYALPVDIDVLGLYPHAHYLGKEMKVFATLPDGSREWLLWIKDWDFNWQDEYRYARPVFLRRGTILQMRFTYDNTVENVRNPNDPPRRVRYGPHSTDEMCDLWIQVVPRNRRDLATLRTHFAKKETHDRIASYKEWLAESPGDAMINFALGSAYQSLGELAEAAQYFRRALQIDPLNSEAHNNLGVMMADQAEFEEAVEHFLRALQKDAKNARVHNNLGNALSALGRLDEGIAHFREAILEEPGYADAHNNLGYTFILQRRHEEAERHLRRALRLNPESAVAHNNLGIVLQYKGQLEEAADHFLRALRVNPAYAEAHNNLGVTLGSQGKINEAIEHFRRALEIQPEYEEARTNLNLALSMRS